MLLAKIFFFGIIIFVAGWMLFVYLFTRRIVMVFLSGEAPFIPTKAKILSGIANIMDVREGDVLYDLGCGDARILVDCYRRQPKAQYIGYEKDIIPYLWAKFRLWRMGLLKKIKVYRKDFFMADLTDATHIYSYLSTKQMEKLEKKFEDELKKNARVFSLCFKLPHTDPLKTVILKEQKELYIYEFNLTQELSSWVNKY